MLNCHQATRLMSEAQERTLNGGEKLSLRFHTMMCSGCRRFEPQIDFLSRSARHYVKRPEGGSDTDDENSKDQRN